MPVAKIPRAAGPTANDIISEQLLRSPYEGESEISDGFMQKAGWRDASSEGLATRPDGP